MDERVRQAGLLCERAVFSGDAALLAEADRELDAAEADLAMARGRLVHTRVLLRREQDQAGAGEDSAELPLFERAARFHQVIRRDNDTAVPLLEQSLTYIAAAAGRSSDALALLDEADAIAQATLAHRITQQVAERAQN